MARADHHENAARVASRAVVAARLIAVKNVGLMEMLNDDEIAVIVERNEELGVVVGNSVTALTTIIDSACDEAVGEVIDRIRKAEGIDTVALDAALGVEPDDLSSVEDAPDIEAEE